MNHHSALTAAPLNPASITSVTPSSLSAAKGAIGFKGYLMDHVSGCYYLGNGYRLYDPRMRAFYSPDSLSPFGAAGLNRYQYCHLDPVNLKDPTGHIPVTVLISLTALLIGVGLHIGAGYWRKQGHTAYADYLDTIGLGFDIGSLVTPVGVGLARAGASVIARSVARAATRQAGRTLQKMVARARLRTVLERGAPTDATPNFQYLPYTSGKIESITLNNSTQFMATEQLTGCAVTVSRTGGAIRVSHVAANVMDSQTWRLSHAARHILREETYGEIASFAGARSGNTWVFGYQSYVPTRTGIAARSGAPVLLPW